MPIVTVHMFRGRSVEQKRRLVKALTESMVEHAGAKPEHLIVRIEEVAPENWAMDGRLAIDTARPDAS